MPTAPLPPVSLSAKKNYRLECTLKPSSPQTPIAYQTRTSPGPRGRIRGAPPPGSQGKTQIPGWPTPGGGSGDSPSIGGEVPFVQLWSLKLGYDMAGLAGALRALPSPNASLVLWV